jgi:hypothetical protein
VSLSWQTKDKGSFGLESGLAFVFNGIESLKGFQLAALEVPHAKATLGLLP